MKKFFGISMICVFTMLLFVTFTYAAWPPTNDTIEYGYAKLNSSSSYVFRNGDGVTLYTDAHISSPGDKIELAFRKNTLDGILLYLGKPDRWSYPNEADDPQYPPGYCSPRSANFLFDIKDGIPTPYYNDYKAAFDILVWTNANKTVRRGNSVGGKYYLNDNSVRLGIRRWLDSSGTLVHDMVFTIENSTAPCLGCGDKAVTETAINAFYYSNDDNYNYEDYATLGTSICDLVVYYISFNKDFTFKKVTNNTWTVSGGGAATLGVVTVTDESSHKTSWIPLATYTNLPFQVTVSKTSGFTAPPRFDIPTTLWGEIKSH